MKGTKNAPSGYIHQTTVSLHDMQASCVFWHVILMFTLVWTQHKIILVN